jgi:tetratricopeptide (TPR) repeat protein
MSAETSRAGTRRARWERLAEAIATAREGRSIEAARLVDDVLEGGADPEQRLVAAHLLYCARQHGRAVELLRSLTGGRLARVAFRDAITLAGRLGWVADVRELLDEAMALEPDTLRWFVEAARIHVRARAWAPALRALEAAAGIEDGAGALWMELAGVAAEAGESARALEAIARALALEDGAHFFLEAARVADLAGDAERAERLLEQGRDRAPTDGRFVRGLAEHRLWRRDDAGALALVDSLQTAEGYASEEEALDCERIRAAVRLFEGDPAGALALLEGEGGDYRRPLLRAEARWRLGDVAGAHQELTKASMSAPGFLPIAWLLRARANFDHELEDNRDAFQRFGVRYDLFGETGELLRGLVDEADAIMREGDPDGVCALYDEALLALGGNRTMTPTRLVDGRAERLPPITGERFAARRALESVRSLPPEEALERLGAVVERFGGSALTEAHRGELLLWLGRYDEARASLEKAIGITEATRWPYIGLSAIDLVEGEWERSLETNARGIRAMEGTIGAAVHVHHGEARYRLGRLDEAVTDLEEALRIHPSRVSARLLLVLALHARDAEGDAARASEVMAPLFEQAIGLLSDAARSLGTVLPEERSLAALAPILEEAVRMLGGNRSSTVMIYRGPKGELRFVPHWPHAGRKPHDGDASDLDRLEGMVRRALRLPEREPLPGPAPQRESADDRAEALERAMLERGYVTLRGAVPRSILRRIRHDSLRRLREAPERFIKDYEPAWKAGAQAFDPNDPATFFRERIDLFGETLLDLPEELPRVWEAICVLVGGEERVAERHICDNVILNLRSPPLRPGAKAPEPGWESWHIDAPLELATFDRWINGLVGVVLVDDVAPGAGATYIAPESVGLLTRDLAAHPEGLDLASRDVGVAISARCTELVELHGEAGDVFLLHPFMLHTASPNPTGRVRWMANPNIALREPLDVTDPRSPIERAITQHLRR